MLKGVRSALVAVLLCCSPALASAQSVPANPTLTYGLVPTVGMWNSWFAAKQDALGFTPLNQAGGSMGGPLTLLPSTTVQAGFNIGVGVAPATPQNGNMWLTPSGLYFQVGGSTIGPITATVGVGCAAMPAFTGDITSMGGSCVTALGAGVVLANIGAGGLGASYLAAGAAASNLGNYTIDFNGRNSHVVPQTGDYATSQLTPNTSGSFPTSGPGQIVSIYVNGLIGNAATFTNSSANIVVASNTPVVGSVVTFNTTGSLPTNFSAGTNYYVVSQSGTTITVSATPAGSAIVAGSAGSGTQTENNSTTMSSTIYHDVAYLAVPAGDWSCSGVILFSANGSAAPSSVTSGISLASNTSPNIGRKGTQNINVTAAAGSNETLDTGSVPETFSSPTQLFLEAGISFSPGAVIANGNLICVRQD